MAATVKGEARETNLELTSHNYQVFSLFFLKTRFVATTSTTSICGSLRSPILVQFLVRHRPCTVKTNKKFSACIDIIVCVHGSMPMGSPYVGAGVKMLCHRQQTVDVFVFFCIFFSSSFSLCVPRKKLLLTFLTRCVHAFRACERPVLGTVQCCERESVYVCVCVCVLASTNAARSIKINFSNTFFDTWQLMTLK